MRRIIPAILLIAVLAIGGGIIATTAYQAGLQTAVATADGTGTTVVVPAYGVGYGWHPFGFGFGFLGFLGALLFFVLVFGLIRAIFFGGRHGHWDGPGWGPGGPTGPDGPGSGRPSGSRYARWEAILHQDFDEWHRGAHGPASGTDGPGAGGAGTTPPAPAG